MQLFKTHVIIQEHPWFAGIGSPHSYLNVKHSDITIDHKPKHAPSNNTDNQARNECQSNAHQIIGFAVFSWDSHHNDPFLVFVLPIHETQYNS